MPDINWAVVENGLDFMESAVQHLAEANERDLRYAALHLNSAIETVVKARLAREHWTLVVADVDKARRPFYETGDFQSVSIKQALARLKEVAGSSCSDEEARRIDAVSKLRNRVAHFALHGDNPRATEATVARGLDVLLHFISRELLPGAESEEANAVKAALERVGEQLGEIQVLVRERMKTLRPDLKAADPPVLTCPGCAQGALVLGDGESAHCLYCFYQREGDVAAADYCGAVLGESLYEAVKQGEQWSVHPCVNCSIDAFVSGFLPVSLDQQAPVGLDVDENTWACFACGYSCSDQAVDTCARCGGITSAADDSLAVCSSCIADYFGRD